MNNDECLVSDGSCIQAKQTFSVSLLVNSIEIKQLNRSYFHENHNHTADAAKGKFKSAPDKKIEDVQCMVGRSYFHKNYRKGQIWSMDLLVAMALLSFILLFSILIWNNLAIRWNSYDLYWQMETSAHLAAEALVTTGGEPKNWEILPQMDDSINAIGIVNDRNEINHFKMQKLVDKNDTSYEFIKGKLGLGKYDLGIRISNSDNSEVYYTFGIFASNIDNQVVSFERMVLVNDSIAKFYMEVWK